MAGPARTTWKRALRRRELASPKRAGRYARNLTWESHLSYARRTWRTLVGIAVATPATTAPLALLHTGAARWSIVGASVASGIWLAVLHLVLYAGAAPKVMGIAAEEMTVDALQSVRRRGWRYVSGVRLGDEIDHIAVGPPGVLVIETKWSADPWPVGGTGGSRFLGASLPGYLAQTRENARQVRRHSYFKKVIAGAPVRPVLVLWSASGTPAEGPGWVEDDGVTIVHGRFLRQWLRSLDSRHLDAEAIDGIWTELSTRIEKSDDYLQKAGGPPRPTLSQLFARAFLQMPLGIIAAAYALRGLLWLDLPWCWSLIGCLAGLGLGLRARGIPRLWWAARGWIVVWAAMCAVFPIVLVIVLLR